MASPGNACLLGLLFSAFFFFHFTFSLKICSNCCNMLRPQTHCEFTQVHVGVYSLHFPSNCFPALTHIIHKPHPAQNLGPHSNNQNVLICETSLPLLKGINFSGNKPDQKKKKKLQSCHPQHCQHHRLHWLEYVHLAFILLVRTEAASQGHREAGGV